METWKLCNTSYMFMYQPYSMLYLQKLDSPTPICAILKLLNCSTWSYLAFYNVYILLTANSFLRLVVHCFICNVFIVMKIAIFWILQKYCEFVYEILCDNIFWHCTILFLPWPSKCLCYNMQYCMQYVMSYVYFIMQFW